MVRVEPTGAEQPKKRFDFGRLMANRSGSEPARLSQEPAKPDSTPPAIPAVAAPTAEPGLAPAPASGVAEKTSAEQSNPIDALEQEMAKLLGRSSQSSS